MSNDQSIPCATGAVSPYDHLYSAVRSDTRVLGGSSPSAPTNQGGHDADDFGRAFALVSIRARIPEAANRPNGEGRCICWRATSELGAARYNSRGDRDR